MSDDPRCVTPYENPQEQEEPQAYEAMLAQHLEVDTVRRTDAARILRIAGELGRIVRMEPTAKKTVLCQIRRCSPRIDSAHGRPVLLVGFDRRHSICPFLRH